MMKKKMIVVMLIVNLLCLFGLYILSIKVNNLNVILKETHDILNKEKYINDCVKQLKYAIDNDDDISNIASNEAYRLTLLADIKALKNKGDL